MNLIPQVKFDKAMRFTTRAVALKQPLMIQGPPGIGKSTLCYGIPDHEKVWEIRTSQIDATDLKGMPAPDLENNLTRWLPMEDMPHDPKAQGILLLDEINATTDNMVFAALYQLVLDRRVGTYRLPDNVAIVATGNRVTDKASARRMPSALNNRFRHIELKFCLSQWTKWALANEVPPLLVSFLKFRPNLIEDFDPDMTINHTPRSWEMVAKDMVANPNEFDIDFTASAIGPAAAADFYSFMQMLDKLPKIDDIFSDPSGTVVPEELAPRLAAIGAAAPRVTVSNVGSFMTYFERFEAPELMAYAMTTAIALNPSLNSTEAVTRWTMEAA